MSPLKDWENLFADSVNATVSAAISGRFGWNLMFAGNMRVRFATQQRDTSGLINHQVKYFAKRTALSPFSYIEGMTDL